MPQIFVRSLERTFAVTVEENATVADLKAAVEDVEFIPTELQRLVCGTRTLVAGDLDLEEEDTVTLLLNVDGGMRAKWRKKRMRRLRRKRRKMRQRAR
mmetsp:Transcript_21213/g.15227  ORF Transcript_21213/g.15227 Transcript_21213/m.15227 type:complete len:98 (-) Transcript_21213:61-354(-)|eukprot:CAMPEP_0116917484 /NCGR_PEP_ID=MMETSP0467-20121206/19170_1 /TAXON_ID=283647 /ORGANISM="Mesodinium pulex, Strain SPMC105" /LENGTH=97 /DNA_ID=CAMNT_0004594585 /DNA_START=77 /DNA_END=370 /DNA_ORIENTATION=-